MNYESEAMKEIRRIRDENSLRHLKMTPEERKKESEEAVQWFESMMGRKIPTVVSPVEPQ